VGCYLSKIPKRKSDNSMYDTSLTDEQWQMIEVFFQKNNIGRPLIQSYRLIFDAILYPVMTGIQWRNLRKAFPKKQTVYYIQVPFSPLTEAAGS
jgi:transposase